MVLVTACGDDTSSPASNELSCPTACEEGEVCFLGECVEDTGQTLEPPENPVCYTPCRGGEGCDDEGLREGCIGGLECVNGTCAAPESKQEGVTEAQPGACTDDGDCPSHQACIAGQCYSDCESDSDCRMERVCVKRVCRLPCTAEGNTCASNEACTLSDGETGFCHVKSEPMEGVALPPGTFSVVGDGGDDAPSVVFSRTKPTGSFTIVNDSDQDATFSFQRASHVGVNGRDADVVTDDALSWLAIGTAEEDPATGDDLAVTVEANGEVEILLEDPANPDYESWDGVLLVSHPTMGTKEVRLSYKASAEGAWAGYMYFVASDFGEDGLDEWLANKHDDNATKVLGNAFIQRWTAFRDNELSLEEFDAVLTATAEGSWEYDAVRNRCPSESNPNANVGCYLSNTPDGISVYSESLEDFPIPSGVSRLPFALNLRTDSGAADFTWTGKVDSSIAMHYPGDPAVSIRFDSDPSLCSGEGDGCKAEVQEFGVDLASGGRYVTTSSDSSCSAATGFTRTEIPDLMEGFGDGGSIYECRDERLPFGDTEEFNDINANLAGSNPIPDGATRRRRLELIDGAMINGERIFLIFREVMPSFIDPNGNDEISGYGWIMLQPAESALDDADYEGTDQTDTRDLPSLPEATCKPSVLNAIGSATGAGAPTLDATTAGAIGVAVINGAPTDLGSPIPTSDIHHYCTDTGQFDTTCDTGRIDYFFFDTAVMPTPPDPSMDACQTSGTCMDVFTGWIDSGAAVIPSYSCPTSEPDCRSSGPFYDPAAGTPAFHPLSDEIADAFRYKTEFMTIRGDSSVGFAPLPCGEGSDYCFDGAAIQEIIDRVDCAVHIYTTYFDDIVGTPEQATMKEYLVENFGFGDDNGRSVDGFERLYAQLLTMLGDESYTDTFTTRFDLAGELNQSFEGSLFEPGGIDLSGPAGFELYSLYRAAQYYQKALDRFYSQANAFRVSLSSLPAGEGFVTQGTATGYIERLLLASSQKARTWSEVARRYQSFNQAELARRVIQRAYASAYLESVVLSDLMRDLAAAASPTQVAQIQLQLVQAQRTYNVALQDMMTVSRQITDDQTIFGYEPDFVPFPTLDPRDTNAFEKALAEAKTSLAAAAEKETAALTDSRAYATNEAEFGERLTTITLDFEGQLAEICGTFTGDDGAVYPAIPRHAAKSERTKALGDPCGFVGNGALYDAILTAQQARVDVNLAQQKLTNITQAIADESERVSMQCDRITDLATWRVGQENEKNSLEDGINSLNLLISTANKVLGVVDKMTELSACETGTSDSCVTSSISAGVYLGTAIGVNIFTTVSESIIVGLEARINDIDRDIVERDIQEECTAAEIDSDYVVRDFYRQILELQLELTKTQLQLKADVAQILKLRNDATATMDTWSQTRTHAINVAAAWNDPNVRIYKNDAILAAERTFERAIRDAYKATKVFEYYTSQSYADKEKLFLIRMVGYGPIPLDQYIADLEVAFSDFEQEFGNADSRVMVVSLLDDILNVPYLAEDNTSISQDGRRAMLREALNDPQYRDGEGRLVFPFGTLLQKVSPRTINHKVLYVEAEVLPKMGDNLGRVYLVQRGTGVLRNIEGGLTYNSLPERTAVLDVFFEGDRSLDEGVYRSERLRDRPLINSGWELVIDTQEEDVNTDLDLGALDDIRLYLYYTDFTSM